MIQDTAEVGNDSRIAGVSVRGLVVMMFVITICTNALVDTWRGIADSASVKAVEGLAGLALGFYLGQKRPQQ